MYKVYPTALELEDWVLSSDERTRAVQNYLGLVQKASITFAEGLLTSFYRKNFSTLFVGIGYFKN